MPNAGFLSLVCVSTINQIHPLWTLIQEPRDGRIHSGVRGGVEAIIFRGSNDADDVTSNILNWQVF